MTKEVLYYRSDKCYYAGNNGKYDHVLKKNGKIDFSMPPEGLRYTATPIEKKQITDWMLDPMFVTLHKFGSKEKLCYMELTSVTVSSKMEQPYKTAATKEARKSRCRIISEKTGREIMCPYDGQHSCVGCDKAADMKRQTSVPLSLDALFSDESGEIQGTLEIPAPNDTEQEFIQKETRECIRAELARVDALARSKKRRAMNLQVYDLWTQDYSFSEISGALGIAKATLHDDLIRIAKIVKKYAD